MTVEREFCSICGRSYSDVVEMADTVMCVDCESCAPPGARGDAALNQM
jgi:hypothetical protein